MCLAKFTIFDRVFRYTFTRFVRSFLRSIVRCLFHFPAICIVYLCKFHFFLSLSFVFFSHSFIGIANVSNYDEDPGVVDDVNTSESESSPKIRRKQKKKQTARHRGCKKIAAAVVADSNNVAVAAAAAANAGECDENKENAIQSSKQFDDVTVVSVSISAAGVNVIGLKPNFGDRFMMEMNRCRAITPPLREHIKLNLPEEKLIHFLKHYLLNSNDLKAQGYPYRYGSKAGFFKKRFSASVDFCLPPVATIVSTIAFDVNAREFVPSHKRRSVDRKLSSDSGAATGSSSSSSSSSPSSSNPSTDSDSSDNTGELKYNERTEKKCIRCTREFHVNDCGEYLGRNEKCQFHWGKLDRPNPYSRMGGTYTCCNSPKYTKGCTTADGHVWNGYEMGFNGPLDGFVRTDEESTNFDPEAHVYALDCEMCYTGRGLEVTKVTMISSDGHKVYEKFVRPDAKIIDYNTRFSGITKKDLSAKNSTVASLPDVQRDLLRLINGDTILIGHALENDLRVLKIIHDNVIDTSVCFPHENGPGFKHSLRFLTSKYLNRSIQDSEHGHSSFEDSRACLELMLWRVRKDFRAVLEQ